VWYWVHLLAGRLDVAGEVSEAGGVAALVIVPADELDKGVVKHDTGVSVKDAGVGVADEVVGHHGVLSVTKDTLELVLGGSLEDLLDLLVAGGLLDLAGKINNTDIRGGDTEGHAGELAVEGRDDLADSLGSTSAGGDYVGASRAASTPVLSTLGGAINSKLVGSHGVDGGHETLDNAKVIVDDLGKRGETVSGAGGVRDNVLAIVVLVVDTHDKHRGVILGRSRDNDTLGATAKVSLALLGCGEDTGRLADELHAVLTPGDVGRVALGVDLDGLAVYNKVAILDLNSALERSVNGVVLEKVGNVVEIKKIVDGYNLDVASLERRAEHEASNAAKAVDSHDRCVGRHFAWCLCVR